MAELGPSSFVLIDLDPDSGDPSGLTIGVEGDTIISSILPDNTREVVTRVEDSSSTWASSIASSLGVFAGSSLPLSGFGAGDTTPAVAAQPGYAYRLVVATDSDRLVWAKGPFSTANIQEGNWESAGASTFNMGNSNFSGTNMTIITRELSIGNSLSAHEDCDVNFDGNLTLSGNLSGGGNIGVIGQIVCGQTGSGTADLDVRDDNSDATIEINAGANYDSLIKFRENNAWRCDMGWDGGENDFFIKTHTGAIRLDPYDGYTVSASCSAITVSSCPVPPPWSFVEVTADDGKNTADAYYFADDSTQSKTELAADHITWDSSDSYFTIANAGWYEFEMQGSITVGSSPTTVTTSIVQTTGLGGTEVEKIDKVQVLRTNIDPHDIVIKWMGYVEAAKNFTCKLDGTGTVRMEKGSTFSCKRIN